MEKIIIDDDKLSLINKKCEKENLKIKNCIENNFNYDSIKNCEKDFYNLDNCVIKLKLK